MNELKQKETEMQTELLMEQTNNVLEATDMIQFRVEELSKTRRLMGKTIAEWETFFKIPIAKQADSRQVSEYASEIYEKLHKAYFCKGKLEAQLTTFMMGYKDMHNDEFLRHALNKGRKTIPKKESLDAIADAKMGEFNLTLVRYEKGIAFFQSMIYKLNTALETVRIIAMSNGTLRKAEMGAF